jgi:hypothetical protein
MEPDEVEQVFLLGGLAKLSFKLAGECSQLWKDLTQGERRASSLALLQRTEVF